MAGETIGFRTAVKALDAIRTAIATGALGIGNIGETLKPFTPAPTPLVCTSPEPTPAPPSPAGPTPVPTPEKQPLEVNENALIFLAAAEGFYAVALSFLLIGKLAGSLADQKPNPFNYRTAGRLSTLIASLMACAFIFSQIREDPLERNETMLVSGVVLAALSIFFSQGLSALEDAKPNTQVKTLLWNQDGFAITGADKKPLVSFKQDEVAESDTKPGTIKKKDGATHEVQSAYFKI